MLEPQPERCQWMTRRNTCKGSLCWSRIRLGSSAVPSGAMPACLHGRPVQHEGDRMSNTQQRKVERKAIDNGADPTPQVLRGCPAEVAPPEVVTSVPWASAGETSRRKGRPWPSCSTSWPLSVLRLRAVLDKRSAAVLSFLHVRAIRHEPLLTCLRGHAACTFCCKAAPIGLHKPSLSSGIS